ncbi:yjeF C-terminal region, hydroxyethylthiazole kinase-related/yjeF N-terminal region [Friedmanniella luteola]|uniref:Bifunctional NAD(P)H-hydrate repair enzyme n=1 Tax=Friedmanniella luteola TaxID=546871 RepID=A0A1H1YVR3_9ACTN|nr:bifunctional ADP-dependent NAD(P)H-hydrate dehydratase/NAD(P)H-hydrate epimerase [Friedmanniella luteola]SDT25409.1 yjeF C-terminal region, hydroxyethylthiazole kinase-related/yjeF N-terminal region [Friedmanniella luteola]
MITAATADTVRELERRTMLDVGDEVLMQRAAAGLAAAVAAELRRCAGRLHGTAVTVLVGPGDNGGDALFAGARLAARGVAVRAVACLGRPHAAGLAALLAAGGRLEDLPDDGRLRGPVTLVVDGVLGIGGRPGLPEAVARLAAAVDDAGWPVVAVDLPSGIDADTGAAPGAAFRADRTVTFGVHKPGHLLEPARGRCGAVDLVDIGLQVTSDEDGGWLHGLEEDDLARAWPYPGPASDKYARGVVGLDAGSDEYPGAGVLATYGAVHAGAGMVRFLGADRPADLVRGLLPNVVFSPGRVQAHLLGSGWGDRPDGADAVAAALDTGLPAVVDADGLRFLPDHLPAGWLLTPHAGELARLLDRDRGWVTADPLRAVREAAARTGATVLLKGASQLVATPEHGWVGVAVPGPAWTAQAGSGDVLGGICATLLAAGLPAWQAALLGASVQAVTARHHPGPLPPHALAERLPETLGRLEARSRALGATR